ncbi:MAG: class I SAM-dependent methyltransferase [Alphaproteobacteria bacterium]
MAPRNGNGDPTTLPEMAAVPPDRIAALQQVPEFAGDSMYNHLDAARVLDYMKDRYVDAMARRIDIRGATLCDCASGYGWLCFAFLLSGGGHATFVEVNRNKLVASQRMAEVLGLADRCTFTDEGMESLSYPDRHFDIFATIETLEHVGRPNIAASIRNTVRLADRMIILTTPNLTFPLDFHDTHLPFAHWLPKPVRRHYAGRFGCDRTTFNDFVGPWELAPLFREFRPVTRVITFDSLKTWEASYPFYSPYGTVGWKRRPPLALKAYYAMSATLLGNFAFLINPSLCSVWVRRP